MSFFKWEYKPGYNRKTNALDLLTSLELLQSDMHFVYYDSCDIMVQFASAWWLLMVWGIFGARWSAWWHRPIDVIHGRPCVMILKYSTSLNLLWITKWKYRVLILLWVIVYENNHETRALFIKPMNYSLRSNNHSFTDDRNKCAFGFYFNKGYWISPH